MPLSIPGRATNMDRNDPLERFVDDLHNLIEAAEGTIGLPSIGDVLEQTLLWVRERQEDPAHESS